MKFFSRLLCIYIPNILLLLYASSIHADPVNNVRYYRVADDRIVIYYDLSGNITQEVMVKVSLDGGKSFPFIAAALTGDAGENVSPGPYKRIVWNVSNDRVELTDDFVIKVLTKTSPVRTEEYLKKVFAIPRIRSTVKLDGFSDEKAWEGIEPLPVVMQIPHFGRDPSERTEIVVAYDDDYFYAAGRLYDSQPSKIHATTNKRDDWKNNTDQFGIVIDTFNDKENALGFITTPTGQRIDITVHESPQGSPGTNASWNTFWDVAVKRTAKGWFAEMRIPFSSLRFQEIDGRVVMGLTAFRWIARKDEMGVFPAIPNKWSSGSHIKPSQAQEIALGKIRQRKSLYITPYLLGGIGQSYNLNNAGMEYKRKDDPAHETGVDIKYGLTSNLTLDATINTDFAQVEADNQQVNLTRYSLFFPEKRLFFMERSSVFAFNFYGQNRLFHSRSIGVYKGKQVRIYGGGRLVGRAGPWDIGFLSMQTEKTEELPSENFGVLRMRRQVINPNSYVGGIVTSRMGMDGTYNTAYGLDGIFHLFGEDYLMLNFAQTFENSGENNPLSLDPAKIRAHWERRTYNGLAYGTNHTRTGSDYNPGMGFEMSENYSRNIGFVRYGFMPGKQSRLLRHIPYVDWHYYWRNPDNSLESSQTRYGWWFMTRSGYSLHIAATHSYEDLRKTLSFSENADVPADNYTFYGMEGNFSTPGGRLFTINTNMNAGSFYDGSRVSFSVSPSMSISSNLELSGTYQFNRILFPDRDQEFNPNIGQLRILAVLSSVFSATSFIQYSSADRKVITNVRFRYNPHEGNDFYLVYDEGFKTDLKHDDPLYLSNRNRTVMFKYTYMFNIQ